MVKNRTHNNISDEDLVRAIISSNDALLFEVLYDRYSRVVFNKCYSFASSQQEAEDLTQDVFLKLFVKLRSFKGNSKFSTWLYAFTYNHCVNYVTRNTAKRIEKQSVDSEGLEERLYDPQIDDKEISQLRVEQLKKALELVTPDEKMILLLKYQDGLSIKELSTNLDIGESAVKMRLKRAKEKLLIIYNDSEYGQSI